MNEHTALTDDQLAAIRQRVETTTAGEWRARKDHTANCVNIYLKNTAGALYLADILSDNVLTFSDAEFIAAAPTDVRALLAEVERLRVEVAAAKVEIDELNDVIDVFMGDAQL